MLTTCIVIPTFRPVLLQQALASVNAQTMQPTEVCVMPDDGTHWIARLNRAIEASSCDAMLMLGDDDLLHSEYLEATLPVMEQTGADICYTDLQYFGAMSHVQAARNWTKEDIDENTSPFITSLFRKSIWEKVGGWNPDLIYADWDFWWKCFEAGAKAVHVHKPLFLYRSPGSNVDHIAARRQIMKHHGFSY